MGTRLFFCGLLLAALPGNSLRAATAYKVLDLGSFTLTARPYTEPLYKAGEFDRHAADGQIVWWNFINGANHAVWDNGSSLIDLHPTNLDGFIGGNLSVASYGWGLDGATQQVGSIDSYDPNTGVSRTHALLWKGTADSVVDLHPTSFAGVTHSSALSVSGSQQVGSAYGDAVPEHAFLWNGSAASAVDLHPTSLAGFAVSRAYRTNGSQQVGAAAAQIIYDYDDATTNYHAMVWSGTADSAVDLHALLPPGFIASLAYDIDANGNIFGTATEASGTVYDSIEWAVVPEPSQISLAALALITLFIRGRGRRASPVDEMLHHRH